MNETQIFQSEEFGSVRLSANGWRGRRRRRKNAMNEAQKSLLAELKAMRDEDEKALERMRKNLRADDLDRQLAGEILDESWPALLILCVLLAVWIWALFLH